MKIPRDFMQQVMHLIEPFPYKGNVEDLTSEQRNELLIQAISMAAIWCYHDILHKELLKHGIDIGEITMD